MKWLLTPCVAVLAMHAVAGAVSPQEPEMVQLEHRYLECDRMASTQLLPFGTAAACSVIAERLLAQRFGGNFDRLLQWWRSARDTGAVTDPFEAAQMHFEAGRYNEAYERFARLADCGHHEAARIALRMHEHGTRLYGLDFAARPQQLMRWQVVVGSAPHDGNGGCSAA